MRTLLRDHWKAIVAIILLVMLAMFTINPGAATPAPTPTLATRLRAHAAALAPGAPAPRYIEATLRAQGYAIRRPDDPSAGRTVRNIEVAVANLAPQARPERIFIVAAHVAAPAAGGGRNADPADPPDTAGQAGAAAVLELARLLRQVTPGRGTEIRFVFFFDGAPAGSGGQDFIAFVGTLESSRAVQQALAAFQGGPAGPARGLTTPAYVQGVTLSGHTAWRGADAPAIMVTDTAFGRYPYYEAADATDASGANPPGQPDYAGIARVVSGLARTIEALAAAQQG